MPTERTYTLKALTDIWTGDAKRGGERLINTGLLGSIRWWFEVIVRGLGGSACDPTLDRNRCPDPRKQPHEPGHHCVVCELFGCTGWARKFRFDVLDEKGQPKQSQIKKDETFKLRFTELRPIGDEEWTLLDLTLRLIADYGAIGGKTVYKPSDEQTRQGAPHHRDYGLIKITDTLSKILSTTKEDLKTYVDVEQRRWRHVDHGDFSWASLRNFWCVKEKFLARQSAQVSSFNKVIGRPEPKHESNRGDSWLAGRRASTNQSPESKKVFSFEEPEDGRRTFGFVRPGTVDFNEMRNRLEQVWSHFNDSEFLKGQKIVDALLRAGSRGTP